MIGDAGAAGGLLDFDLATQKAFNAAFWASYPPIIGTTFNAATTGNTDRATLIKKALEFSQQGYKLQAYIFVAQQDPYITMRLLAEYGFSSVPAIGEPPVTLVPSLGGPSAAGSFKVSVNPADYPPFPVPPPPPVVGRSPVGPLLTGKLYIALMPESARYHNGDPLSVDGKTYTLSFASIFAPPMWILQ